MFSSFWRFNTADADKKLESLEHSPAGYAVHRQVVAAVPADGANLDGFGRQRVSSPRTLFDSQQEYGLCTRRCWDGVVYNGTTVSYTITNPSSNGSVSANGNAVGPASDVTGLTPVTVSSTSGHYAILQSRQYIRYIPGYSHLIKRTGIFASEANASAHIVLRSSTSGSVVDLVVDQADWSEDTFINGSSRNPSEIHLDLTKIQIMIIDAQMLYAGRVRVGFDIGGVLYWAHYFKIANLQALPTVKTFCLPKRMEARTEANRSIFRTGYFDSSNGVFLETRSATKGGTIYHECSSVMSEGGGEARGFPHTAKTALAGRSINAETPVISIRPAATYNGRTNRAHIEELEAILTAQSQNVQWELVIGGTLTNANWLSVPIDSAAEYDISATAITGGVPAKGGICLTGSGAARGQVSSEGDFRFPLTISLIDALVATQVSVSLVCTPLTGTATVNATLNWHEQVV